MAKHKEVACCINKGAVNYDNLVWCIRALSKDKDRGALACLFIDKGKAIATDGHRLHLIRLIGDHQFPKDGIYSVTKTKSELIFELSTEVYSPSSKIEGVSGMATFIDSIKPIRQLCKKARAFSKTAKRSLELRIEDHRVNSSNFANLYASTVRLYGKNTINAQFLSDILRGAPQWIVYKKAPRTPLYFISKSFTTDMEALLMPIGIK